MNKETKKLIKLLSEWERIAFDFEIDFMERFCHGGLQLIHVYWNCDNMKTVYLLNSGATVTDSTEMKEWLDFYNDKIKK